MAERKMTKDSTDFKAFMAVWDFFKEFGTPEKDDGYWEKMIEQGSKKVGLNPELKGSWDLSTQLLVAVNNVIDARAISMKKYGDDKHGYEVILERSKNKNKSRASGDKNKAKKCRLNS